MRFEMFEKKFKLVAQENRALYTIKALRAGLWGPIGTVGGFVAKEENLSQLGDCWIYDDAQVHGNARVFDDAIILGNVIVADNVLVYGKAQVYDNSSIFGSSRIYGEARVYGRVCVSGEACVLYNLKCYPYYINASKHNVFYVGHKDEKPMIMIGCEIHSLEHWLENYKEIGVRHFYFEKEIKEYSTHLESMRRLLDLEEV